MPTELEEASPLLQQLWAWWQSLDDTVVRVLEGIYERAPDAVATVISGGQPDLLLAESGVGLGEHLRAQLAASRPLTESSSLGTVDVVLTRGPDYAPLNPPPGASIDLSWAWTNRGADSPEEPIRAKALLLDSEGRALLEVGDQFSFPRAGEESEAMLRFDDLPEGRWWIRLFAPYVDGMESAAGSEISTLPIAVGDPDANLEQGAANPAEGFFAASEQFAAASAAASAGDAAGMFQEFTNARESIEGSMALLQIEHSFGGGVQPNAVLDGPALAQALSGLGLAIERVALRTLETIGEGGRVDALDEWAAFLSAWTDADSTFAEAAQREPYREPTSSGDRFQVAQAVAFDDPDSMASRAGVVDRIDGETAYVTTAEGDTVAVAVEDLRPADTS